MEKKSVNLSVCLSVCWRLNYVPNGRYILRRRQQKKPPSGHGSRDSLEEESARARLLVKISPSYDFGEEHLINLVLE